LVGGGLREEVRLLTVSKFDGWNKKSLPRPFEGYEIYFTLNYIK